MKENSREEDIALIEKSLCDKDIIIQYHYWVGTDFLNAVERIVADYKRVLKENESLQKTYDDCYCKYKHYKQFESISIQKVKDIIDRIDYDIKKTKEIISKNTNIFASYRKNDYQIVRLKAMNTKSLDIKKRLQELLESEK